MSNGLAITYAGRPSRIGNVAACGGKRRGNVGTSQLLAQRTPVRPVPGSCSGVLRRPSHSGKELSCGLFAV